MIQLHFHCVWNNDHFALSCGEISWMLAPDALLACIKDAEKQLADTLPYPQTFRLNVKPRFAVDDGRQGIDFKECTADTFATVVSYLRAVYDSWYNSLRLPDMSDDETKRIKDEFEHQWKGPGL